MKKVKKSYEVVILGGGPAGIAAGIWCAELGLNAALIEASSELGGQLLWTHNPITNYPGRNAKNGCELKELFDKQLRERKLGIQTGCLISKIDLRSRAIQTEDGPTLAADAVIIATGIRRRKLGVAGEEKYRGKGIIESGSTDQQKLKGKEVCIVGGGDAAAENALILSQYARQVTLVHRRDSFRARSEFVEKVSKSKNIRVLLNTQVKKIDGAEKLESVELEDLKTNSIYSLPMDNLLIRIGVEPNSEMFREQLTLDKNGYIKVDVNCQTSVRNVFAVGDVANPVSPTIATAVGMGATAAKTAYKLLQRNA